jgi:hypothetical protein
VGNGGSLGIVPQKFGECHRQIVPNISLSPWPPIGYSLTQEIVFFSLTAKTLGLATEQAPSIVLDQSNAL